MGETQLWAMGYLPAVLAFGVAVAGVVIGSACWANYLRSRHFRLVWAAGVAGALGGVGIWLTQVISLLGLQVPNTELRYDRLWLSVSVAVVLGSVFGSVLLVGREQDMVRMLGGGATLGIGSTVALYLEFFSIHLSGTAAVTLWWVLVAGVVNVGGAMGCVWLLHKTPSLVARAGIMLLGASTIVGGYYLSVLGLQLTPNRGMRAMPGHDLFAFVFPLFVLGTLLLAGPISAVLLAPQREPIDNEEPESTALAMSGSDG